MATAAAQRVALLSIHPRFADAILTGEKQIEFRRVAPSQSIDYVLVYATAPVQMIVGYFEVDSVVCDQPQRLWQEFSAVGGIDKDDFDDYYFGTETGYGLRVRAANRFTTPVPLAAVGVGRPPQSFQYIDRERALTLVNSPARRSTRWKLLAPLTRLIELLSWRASVIGEESEQPSRSDVTEMAGAI